MVGHCEQKRSELDSCLGIHRAFIVSLIFFFFLLTIFIKTVLKVLKTERE